MSGQIFLHPRNGLTVINPAHCRELPAGGAWVPNDRHWRRLLAAGDVVIGKPKRSKKPSKTQPKPKPTVQDDEAQQ